MAWLLNNPTPALYTQSLDGSKLLTISFSHFDTNSKFLALCVYLGKTHSLPLFLEGNTHLVIPIET